MKIKLAISTCPNDTFIFDALVNKRLDMRGYKFDVTLTDIQELNNLALSGEATMVKISYALYPLISKDYQLLTAGSALGSGVGPLVVSKRKIYPDEVEHAKIAIPGKTTTANFLLSLAFPKATNKKVYLFSDIEEAVLQNEVDLGVLIHEGRFTYKQKGLFKVMDLGEYWEKTTSCPIPLGGIAIRRDLPDKVKHELNTLTKQSVEYAFSNRNLAMPFVKTHAQEMDEEVILSHIELYVNNFSIDLGERGKNAVLTMLEKSSNFEQYKGAELIEPFFVC
ncbi:MAG: 1,4-dihydroxy-6-naphthoate synthase [Bacteroidales bacterium]|jgi:1,4-dihydroxy-6-naphthoate synthase|nr:1,4-dihydroxy-6-naphthoate synthase [Bacteroidales bacterium]MDD4384547.1 1,4-dihydroxy-6-naphthoate synthase [Bacteroidales bacterium]MDY0197478.1 1,4-dihydroxy-6-naphthoate synthase [Tenuifilaceae bacterium]